LKAFKIVVLGFILFFTTLDIFAQGEKRIIQFSGIIVGEDSISGVPGVHIFVPKAGRGTTSNPYGYFSMPLLENDSLIISAVGYKRIHYVIPEVESENYTVIIELQSDTTILPELEVFPYPTEEIFKEAILALQIPYQSDLDNLRRNLDAAMLRKMYNSTGMTAGGNHNYYMNQQMNAWNNQFQQASIPLLNPFAWAKFIKSIKRGDLKRKKK
jgi:hypothetical protein